MVAKLFSNRNSKGFSIIELIITLALLGIVIAGIYTLYFYIQTSFNNVDSRSAINNQINFTFMQMTKDIRSASKPNPRTMSVRVVSSAEMHVYTYDAQEDKYIMIGYRFDFERKILQRGWVACNSEKPGDEENPSYGAIENWDTVMENVAEKAKNDGGEFFTGFEDVTSVGTNERREIKITLIGSDYKRSSNKPIISVKTLTSRSKGFPQ